MGAILDIGTERFSNFKSPCHLDTSLQVSVQSALQYWRRSGLKNFMMVLSWTLEQNNFTNAEFP